MRFLSSPPIPTPARLVTHGPTVDVKGVRVAGWEAMDPHVPREPVSHLVVRCNVCNAAVYEGPAKKLEEVLCYAPCEALLSVTFNHQEPRTLFHGVSCSEPHCMSELPRRLLAAYEEHDACVRNDPVMKTPATVARSYEWNVWRRPPTAPL